MPALTNWRWLVALPLAGFVLAVFGTYWDDAWHTEEGRDTFFIAPHLVLYAGIAMTGAAFSIWALFAARASGLRNALRHPPLLLGLIGVAVTLVAAPIDNVWHELFGRDAVIWSPPHMLGVAGSLLIAAALLLELGPKASGIFGIGAAVIAAAAVVAVTAIPVLEYETDVPQFDVIFYLPILASGIAFAFGLIRLALPFRFGATGATLAYSVIVGSIALILIAAEMPAPLLPLLALPALAFDLSRRLRLVAQAALLTLVLYAIYLPYLNWIKSDLFLEVGDVALGMPLALLGSAAALLITAPRFPASPRGVPRQAVVTAVLMLLLLPGTATAHDPGQGDELTTGTLSAAVDGDQATLSISPASHCPDLEPRRLVARRAELTETASLRIVDTCEFSGRITLPERGRWFLYAEFLHEDEPVETWIAAAAGGTETITDEGRSIYAPPKLDDSPLKLASGVVIYVGLALTLVLIPVVYRRRLNVAAPGLG